MIALFTCPADLIGRLRSRTDWAKAVVACSIAFAFFVLRISRLAPMVVALRTRPTTTTARSGPVRSCGVGIAWVLVGLLFGIAVSAGCSLAA